MMPVTCSGTGNRSLRMSSRDSLTNSQPMPAAQSARRANSTIAIRRPAKPRRPSMSAVPDRSGEDVADAAHGLDQLVAASDLLAQPADLHVDSPIERVGAPPSGPVHQLLAREHAIGARQKAAEQLEFGAGQRDGAAVGIGDVTRVEVDAERGVDQEAPALRRRRLNPAQDRANARDELARV